jgi:iron complex transport system substrate-binding protein
MSKPNLRIAPLGVALAVFLAACGSPTSDTTVSGDATATTVATDTTVATEQSTTSSAPTTTAVVTDPSQVPEGRGVVTDNSDGTRTVEWADGSAVVPASPERIVTVIGDIDLESLIALGMPPIASGTQDGTVEGGFAPHLADVTADVQPLAWSDGVPYESIAALSPDIIFSYGEFDQLSPIAPAVPSGSWIGTEWREDFRYIAEVVGQGDQADEVLAELQTRIDEVSAAIADTTEGLTVVSAQVAFDHSQVYLEPADSFASAVLTDLGLELDPLVEGTSGDLIPLSFERLDEIQADIIFWQVRQGEGGAPDEEGVALVTESPLWETLPAVQADQVFFVENRPWYFPTILGVERIINDVETALADTSS